MRRVAIGGLLISLASVALSPEAGVPMAETTLVRLGAAWRYLDDGSDPGTAWRGTGFDDSGWAEASAELGYGDGDERTVVRALRSNSVPIISTYFRRSFVLKSRTAARFARIRLLADDGAVVYLNGVEVARSRMPAGAIGHQTLASQVVDPPEEFVFQNLTIDATRLVKGRNVLAVEVHQGALSADDLSFDLEFIVSDGVPVVARGPYLQRGTHDSMIVRWRTDWPTETALWLGAAPTNLSRRSFDNRKKTEHEVLVSGLTPETRYFYAVGDASGHLAGDASHSFETSPRPGDVRDARIWVVGDSGSGTLTAAVVRDAYLQRSAQRRADLWLMLGDNAYLSGNDDQYQKAMFDMYPSILRNTVVWSTLGNHDAALASSTSGSGPYYDIFSLPTRGEAGGVPSGTEAYYSFDRGHIHFICLNSQDVPRTATGAMAAWLRADLAATSARWLIAFFHHPPYTKGTHDSDLPTDSEGRLIDMRQVFLPILEAGGVDLVMTGHSHVYERSFLLDGHYGLSTTLQPSMVLDRGDGRASGDGVYAKPTQGLGAHEGAVYVVAGCSSLPGGGTLDHPAMHVGIATLGSMLIDVSGDRLDATFFDFQNIVRDSFTLVKGEKRTLRRVEPSISVSQGGTQTMLLDAGAGLAGALYFLSSSFGTTPGFRLGGLQVPLNPDPWFDTVIAMSNSPVFQNTRGVLDPSGQATARFVFPGVINPSLVGLVMHQAFVVADSTGRWRHASNPVRLTLIK